jgi:hypothetical protein
MIRIFTTETQRTQRTIEEISLVGLVALNGPKTAEPFSHEGRKERRDKPF